MAENSIWSRVGDAIGWSGDRMEKAAVPTQELGTSQSYVADGSGTFDASERLHDLIGPRRFDEFDRMIRDTTIIAAGVRLMLNLIANAVWTVNPPEDLSDNEAAVAQGYADDAYDMLFATTTGWSSIVRKIAGYRFFGFSIMEWTAVRRADGKIGFKDIAHRPQRTIIRWVRDKSGTIEGVVQRVAGRLEVTLPRSKIIYAVDDTLTDNPEGMGLLRHLYETSERLKLFLGLEETGFTTDLRGIPIGRAPLGELQKKVTEAGPAGSENRAKAEAERNRKMAPLRDFIMKHVRNKKTGIFLPSDTFHGTNADKGTTPSTVYKWALELLNGDSSGFADIANAINRMNQEMARVLGVEHLMLGSDGSGSLALARSKVGTFYLTVTSTLLDIVEVCDRDALTPISDLNGWPEELRPQMGVNEISDRDIEQVMDALAKLAQAGAPMLPGDPAEGEVYDQLGLTRPPDRIDDMDMALVSGRTGRPDPDAPIEANPEDKVKKARLLRSRANMQKRARRAWR